MNKTFIRYALSCVIGIEGVFLILTSIIALIYHEDVFIPYFLTGLFSCLLGFLGYKKGSKSFVFYAKEGFIVVALGWIVMSLIGAFPIFITGEIPYFLDAVFEIVSGFTTTGSTICPDVEALSHCSNFWRCLTHWIGGMGVLVFILAILPMSGGYAVHIMKAESPGPVVSKLVSRVSDSAKILYLIYAVITAIECAILVIFGMPLFDAACAAFGTAGTGGFGIRNDSMASYSNSIQLIVTIFMILFGINFNVYFLALTKRFKDAIKSEEVRWYLAIVAIATLLISVNTFHQIGSLYESIHDAFFQVGSIITTTGFATVDFDMWPMFSKTILIMLMFCGACAGSTGGGIKVSRIAIAIKDAFNSIGSYIHPRRVKRIRFEGKVVQDETIYSIRSYICVYALIFMISMLIVSFNNFSFGTNFSAVAATFNNIGPGIDVVGPTSNFMMFNSVSKIVFIFDMLAGRLEIIPMLVLFSPATYKEKA